MTRTQAAWLSPWSCLRAVIARDRAIAEGVPWVTSRAVRARRLALLRGMPEPEERSLLVCSLQFYEEEGIGDGGMDRAEYLRLYQQRYRKKKKIEAGCALAATGFG